MADVWAEDERFPVADWQAEVAAGDTRRGYRDWLDVKRDDAEDEAAGG